MLVLTLWVWSHTGCVNGHTGCGLGGLHSSTRALLVKLAAASDFPPLEVIADFVSTLSRLLLKKREHHALIATNQDTNQKNAGLRTNHQEALQRAHHQAKIFAIIVK
jgi:hypothetical protein